MTSSAKSRVFRVTGIPVGKAELDVQATLAGTIHHLLSTAEQQQLNVKIACIPSCDQSKTSSALVEFGGGTPEFLAQLDRDPLSDWQVESGNEDVNFDRHFSGFTQLYSTTPGRPVTADLDNIIAITGLDGHAYGSWRGKGNLGRMWLRDFLSKDLPQCRTMIYGYNSKLSSRGVDTIMDYAREFLERIKRVRYTKELRERPLFFIAHSFGGVILAHSLVKAVQTDERDHATIAALPKATYGILFFATPHKGLLIDDIKRMIAGDDDHPRTELLEQIKARSDLLMYQLINFKNHIRDWKIVSFYETLQTRQLKFNNETQSWSRSGAYLTAVTSDSAILQLPDSMEVKVPVSADHSQIVKFDNRNDDTYQMALRYLMEFEKDAGKIISGRFSTTNILSHTPGTQQRKGAPKSTVPFDRDKNFVGRQDILVALESKFSQVGSHNRVALVGLGGIGKSQIAIEYSYRLRERDPQTWVFWVHAGNAVKFEQAFRSIAATLEFPGWDNPKVDVLGLVSRWLGNVENGPWFMILDNADNIDVFRQTREENSQNFKTPQHATTLSGYIPQTANGSVLITTRDKRAAAWLSGEYENIVSIDLMDEDEAKRLLGMRIPPSLSTEPDLGHLVRELEYLPLAITQAAAYISARATRMTVFKYLTLYCQSEANQRRLLDEDFGDLRRDQGVPNSVIRTWRISFDQIQETYTKSAQLLSLMAMLDRQSIPEFLISATYQDPLDFEDALSPLNEFSLITVEKGGKSFEMHRLVQLATRNWLAQRMDIQRWQEEATNALSKEFPSGEHSNWGICETLLPHAREVLKYKPVSSNHFLARGSLLHNMAWYSWRQGRYAIARQQIEESLAIREQQLDSSHKSVIGSAGLLGIVLNAQGKYAEAEVMDRKALAGRETALGPEHPNTLTSVSNLALTLRAQGKYTEAEVMNRKALAGRETVLGLEHSGTLMSVSNLADTLYAQGKYAEAEAMNRKALVSRETVLGTEHPDTLMSISNLANTLNAQGKHAEAEAMNRKALASRETALGPEHPETLRSVSNLASTLNAQDKYAEAETMNWKALAGREATLGLEHPDTLMSVYWLAYQLHGQRRYASASVLYQRACKGYQEVLGADHPTTLACSEHYSAMVEERDMSQTAMQD